MKAVIATSLVQSTIFTILGAFILKGLHTDWFYQPAWWLLVLLGLAIFVAFSAFFLSEAFTRCMSVVIGTSLTLLTGSALHVYVVARENAYIPPEYLMWLDHAGFTGEGISWATLLSGFLAFFVHMVTDK